MNSQKWLLRASLGLGAIRTSEDVFGMSLMGAQGALRDPGGSGGHLWDIWGGWGGELGNLWSVGHDGHCSPGSNGALWGRRA